MLPPAYRYHASAAAPPLLLRAPFHSAPGRIRRPLDLLYGVATVNRPAVSHRAIESGMPYGMSSHVTVL